MNEENQKNVPFNLAEQDLPHQTSDTEWWYVNTHFVTSDGREFSLFASFFKFIKSKNPYTYSYLLTWALSDIKNNIYLASSQCDKSVPELGLEMIDQFKDALIRECIADVLKQNKLILPDELFEGSVSFSTSELNLDYDGSTFKKLPDNSYELKLANKRIGVECCLNFKPQVKPVLHGNAGQVNSSHGEEMFYYFIPNCKVSGNFTMNDESFDIESGKGWYDHEYGGFKEEKNVKERSVKSGWNWASIQMDNGKQLSVYTMMSLEDGQLQGKKAVVIDADGSSTSYDDFVFEPDEQLWRSKQTFNEYPLKWKITIPEPNIKLEMEALFPNQEFVTFVLPGLAFWEGTCGIQGTWDDKKVRGQGFIERQGFSSVNNVKQFFDSVSKEVNTHITDLIHPELTAEEWRDLIYLRGGKSILTNIDFKKLHHYLLEPILSISERGGKAWRPYALLASCNAVGGDFTKYLPLLAGELVHVGSLIVDDVQDHSEIRRGGLTAHRVYGEAIALNAGTMAYFIPEVSFKKLLKDVPAEVRCRIYELYFESVRAAHAGQALDIAGQGDCIDKIISKEIDVLELEKNILMLHRLKSGVPAGSLARTGGLLGNANEQQVDALGSYFEILGQAFQIIDDVLNIRGEDIKFKTKGEDLIEGKITFPVAKAGEFLPTDEFIELLKIIRGKKYTYRSIAEIIDKLEACGALEASISQARQLIEDAWDNLNPLLEDSLSKVMLKVFGKYVITRHY